MLRGGTRSRALSSYRSEEMSIIHSSEKESNSPSSLRSEVLTMCHDGLNLRHRKTKHPITYFLEYLKILPQRDLNPRLLETGQEARVQTPL